MSQNLLVNYYLLEFPNKPFPLLPSKTYTIGRDEGNSIQINSSFVSRKHTSIYFFNDSFYVKDLGSTNGTFVNSQKIEDVLLHDGDQVGIGDRIYVFHQRAKDYDIIDKSIDNLTPISEKITVSRRGQMNGDFSEFSILEVMQYLSTRNRTGSLLINCVDGSDGLVNFREGHIEHAFYQGLKGEEALKRIIQSALSQFQFEPKHQTDMVSIECSTNSLFLDLLKLKDKK